MTYSSPRADLERIVQWLQSTDESHWDKQTPLLSGAISGLQKVSNQTTKAPGATLTSGSTERPSSESETFSPKATAVNVAMPQLMKMLKAMHEHNRAAALEYGQAALGLLPEG
jgi:hypothetical protein